MEKAIKYSTETPFTCSSLTYIAESKLSKQFKQMWIEIELHNHLTGFRCVKTDNWVELLLAHEVNVQYTKLEL